MRNNLWIKLAALLVSSVLVLAVSCHKKSVAVQKGSDSTAKVDEYMAPTEEKSHVEAENVDLSSVLGESESDRMGAVVMQENIYFEFDKSTLTPAAKESLMKKGEWFRMNPDVIITIEGHCDERGTTEYNLALGDRRAENVKTFLYDLGIDTSRIKTISYGEERPADPRHNDEAWAQNRRAHFMIN